MVRRWLGRRHGGHDDGAARRTDGPDWATIQLESRGIRDPAVLQAMRAVPRERFVPEDMRELAYEDGALPIGHGQTISQPYIVARMTELLALDAWRAAHQGATPPVLDVGTGSGYQAAVLAHMGMNVTSVELEPELAERAREVLGQLGYTVRVIVGDGSQGAPDWAPFAGIVTAAAAPDVPAPLAEQLLPDGRLVIPLGTRFEQVITVVRRDDGGFRRDPVEPAVFVPLLGEHGFGGR